MTGPRHTSDGHEQSREQDTDEPCSLHLTAGYQLFLRLSRIRQKETGLGNRKIETRPPKDRQ